MLLLSLWTDMYHFRDKEENWEVNHSTLIITHNIHIHKIIDPATTISMTHIRGLIIVPPLLLTLHLNARWDVSKNVTAARKKVYRAEDGFTCDTAFYEDEQEFALQMEPDSLHMQPAPSNRGPKRRFTGWGLRYTAPANRSSHVLSLNSRTTWVGWPQK